MSNTLNDANTLTVTNTLNVTNAANDGNAANVTNAANDANTANVTRVVLTATHARVTVPAAVAARVVEVLRVGVTAFAPGGPRGHRSRRGEETYYSAAPGGELAFPPGLLDRVVDHLGGLGLEAVVDDRRRYRDRQQPDRRVLARGRPDLLPFLLAAAERHRGTDSVAGREDLADRVAALCRLFPAARAMVLETNTALAEDLYRRLFRRLGGQVFRGSEDFWAAPVRRVVAPLPKLDVLSPDDFDVLIAADARTVCARGHWSALRRLWVLRAYGFQPVGWAPSAREQLRVEGVFGRPLVPTTAPRCVAVHATVPPRTLPPPNGADPLERKREAIWRNVPRNKFVAAVAMAIAANDEVALAPFGLARLGCALRALGRGYPKVAVLVESPEHARHLMGHLSGWRSVRYEPRLLKPGWGGCDPTAPLRDPDGFDRTVITTMAARRVESLDVDVLVRADGAGSPLRLPGFLAAARESDRPQVLIDFADDFDCAAEADTRARLRTYRTAGWVIGAAPQWATSD